MRGYVKKTKTKKSNHRFSQSYKQPYSITDLFFCQTNKTEQKESDLKAGTIRPSNHKVLSERMKTRRK